MSGGGTDMLMIMVDESVRLPWVTSVRGEWCRGGKVESVAGREAANFFITNPHANDFTSAP